jgi:hypothetical protein
VTELLSGDFFVPFGRSTSHQMWSSAMVITPAVRGLFGLSFDAEHKSVIVDPHLPATWQGATLRHAALKRPASAVRSRLWPPHSKALSGNQRVSVLVATYK